MTRLRLFGPLRWKSAQALVLGSDGGARWIAASPVCTMHGQPVHQVRSEPSWVPVLLVWTWTRRACLPLPGSEPGEAWQRLATAAISSGSPAFSLSQTLPEALVRVT